ncbi:MULTISPECIES: hypothetical protein [unclassified Pseudomonas]|uniref:hypothetical protein n=1 Tax=unclassified Pseudomonas TaxID=196821 RepID=UPI001113C40B|nr:MULTISPECIES: hypothetical protein [unclassified Pseudomonas]
MAYKYIRRYGAGDSASTIMGGQNKVGDAQKIANDAGTLSGSNTPGQKIQNHRDTYRISTVMSCATSEPIDQ